MNLFTEGGSKMKAKAAVKKAAAPKAMAAGKTAPKKEAAAPAKKQYLSVFIRGLQTEGVDKEKGLQRVVDRLIADGQYDGDRDRAMKRAKVEWGYEAWLTAKKAKAAAPVKGKGKKTAAA
jgi:hypothetical protein